MTTFCAAAVHISNHDAKQSVSKQVTIGGLIEVDGTRFALVATNAFWPNEPSISTQGLKSVGIAQKRAHWEKFTDMRGALSEIEAAGQASPNEAVYENKGDKFVLSFGGGGRWPSCILRHYKFMSEPRPVGVTPHSQKTAWSYMKSGWALLNVGPISDSLALNTVQDQDGELDITRIKYNNETQVQQIPQGDIVVTQHLVLIAASRGAIEARLHDTLETVVLAGETDLRETTVYTAFLDWREGDVGSWVICLHDAKLLGSSWHSITKGKMCGSAKFFRQKLCSMRLNGCCAPEMCSCRILMKVPKLANTTTASMEPTVTTSLQMMAGRIVGVCEAERAES